MIHESVKVRFKLLKSFKYSGLNKIEVKFPTYLEVRREMGIQAGGETVSHFVGRNLAI